MVDLFCRTFLVIGKVEASKSPNKAEGDLKDYSKTELIKNGSHDNNLPKKPDQKKTEQIIGLTMQVYILL